MGAVISTIQDIYATLTSILKTFSALNTQYQALLNRISSSPGLPVPNPTSSYWLDNPPFPHLTDIQGDVPSEADVVIIGSGITGAAIAKCLLELSDGLKVVVCEARQICSGATGRNGGHIKCAPYDVFANMKGKLGPERARKITRFQRRHLKVLLEVGETIPEGQVREVETVDLFLEKKDFEKAKEAVWDMEGWIKEEECRILSAEEVGKQFGVNEMVVGGIAYTAGALWPYGLITGVWNGLLKKYPGLTISTHTAVEAITKNTSSSCPYTIKTSRGTFQTRHVIHATNAYASNLLPSLRQNITGALAHMSAQKPGNSFPLSHGKRSWSPIYLPGFDYVTQLPDNEDGTPGDLMIGGGFFRSKEDGLDQVGVWDDSRVDALPAMHIRGVMPAMFEPNWGGSSEVKKAWTGVLGVTGDFMPLIGRLPNSTPSKESGEWIAAGFCGEGMVWAWLCGTALALMILGKENERLEAGVGRPGGLLEEWFPREELAITKERLKRANLKNLMSEI